MHGSPTALPGRELTVPFQRRDHALARPGRRRRSRRCGCSVLRRVATRASGRARSRRGRPRRRRRPTASTSSSGSRSRARRSDRARVLPTGRPRRLLLRRPGRDLTLWQPALVEPPARRPRRPGLGVEPPSTPTSSPTSTATATATRRRTTAPRVPTPARRTPTTTAGRHLRRRPRRRRRARRRRRLPHRGRHDAERVPGAAAGAARQHAAGRALPDADERDGGRADAGDRARRRRRRAATRP